MIHTGADYLDLAIYRMMAAQLSDTAILRLVPLRMRYAAEPTWPALDPSRLGFARYLAEAGLIGRMDRHPSLQGIKDFGG